MKTMNTILLAGLVPLCACAAPTEVSTSDEAALTAEPTMPEQNRPTKVDVERIGASYADGIVAGRKLEILKQSAPLVGTLKRAGGADASVIYTQYDAGPSSQAPAPSERYFDSRYGHNVYGLYLTSDGAKFARRHDAWRGAWDDGTTIEKDDAGFLTRLKGRVSKWTVTDTYGAGSGTTHEDTTNFVEVDLTAMNDPSSYASASKLLGPALGLDRIYDGAPHEIPVAPPPAPRLDGSRALIATDAPAMRLDSRSYRGTTRACVGTDTTDNTVCRWSYQVRVTHAFDVSDVTRHQVVSSELVTPLKWTCSCSPTPRP